MKIRLINILLFFSVQAMAQDVSKEMEITLLPYKTVTNGAFFQVIVLSSPECYVQYLHAFDYEWGFTYTLRIKETHLENPPMDGSSYEYELLEVVSKTAVSPDYTFKMGLSRDLYLGEGADQINNFRFINDSTYRYMDEINIEYSADKGHLFDQILSQNKYIRGTFVFIDSNTIRLK